MTATACLLRRPSFSFLSLSFLSFFLSFLSEIKSFFQFFFFLKIFENYYFFNLHENVYRLSFPLLALPPVAVRSRCAAFVESLKHYQCQRRRRLRPKYLQNCAAARAPPRVQPKLFQQFPIQKKF